LIDIAFQDKADSILGNEFDSDIEALEDQLEKLDSNIWVTARFNELEDLIQLSHSFHNPTDVDISTALFHYENRYYLYVELSLEQYDEQENVLSQVLEFAEEVDMTVHYL